MKLPGRRVNQTLWFMGFAEELRREKLVHSGMIAGDQEMLSPAGL
jgi:hypothetical protein